MLAHDSMPSTFVLYTNYRYHWDQRTVGLVLAAVGVASMIVQGGLVGRLVAWLGERFAMLTGFACGALGMTIYSLAPTGRAFMTGIPFTALYGLSNPSLRSLMSQKVGPTEQGQLQGANASLLGMASLLAPVMFTQVFAEAVGRLRVWNVPGAPFLLAAILLAGALLVGERATRRVTGEREAG